MTMVSEGLTEVALRQWNSTCDTTTATTTTANSRSKDPPGDLCRDPPGAMIEMNPKLGLMEAPLSPGREESSTSEDDSDDYDSELVMGEEGDEEDDGLFIGATSCGDLEGEDEDSSIAFSDIVLPTEEEDPFLQELAEAAVQEAVEQVEQEHAHQVVRFQLPAAAQDAPQEAGIMTPTGGIAAVKESPTEHPNPKLVLSQHQHQQALQQVQPVVVPAAPVTPTFSAHVIVAHSVDRKKAELQKMSQKELLTQLEKRLRPYMQTPLKLPPLRRRKRPNCLFLNHMGTRKAPMPPNARKRKIAATSATTTEVQEPRKKRAMPTLPKKSNNSVTVTPPKPRTITAPSSPAPAIKKSIIDIPTPSPVPSTPNTLLPKSNPVHSTPNSAVPSTPNDTTAPGVPSTPTTFLPKLLTESESWEDDLINKTPSPRKTTTSPGGHSNFSTPEPSPLPPLSAVDENRQQLQTPPSLTSNDNKKTNTKKNAKKNKKVQVLSPQRKKADAPEEADGLVRAKHNQSCPSPELAPKKAIQVKTKNNIKKSIYADPPGCTAEEVKPPPTVAHLPKSPAHSFESDDASVNHMEMDEPLPPSFEHSFHNSFVDHDDSLASLLLADDSNQDHHHSHPHQAPASRIHPEAVRSTPHHNHEEVVVVGHPMPVYHDDLEATPNSMADTPTNHESTTSSEKAVLRLGHVAPPEILIPMHSDDMPPLPPTAAAAARRPRSASPTCPRTPPSKTSKPRPYVCLEHRAEGPVPPLLPPPHGPRRVGMPRPMILSPEMDVLSPAARYAAQPRYELPYDEDYYGQASPSVAARHPHHHLHHHPQQRRVIAMRPVPYGAERLYYRRTAAGLVPVYRHHDGHHPDHDMSDDDGCWDPLVPTRCPSSPTSRAPYVTPDTTMSPGFRKPMVLEPGRDDWVIHRDLPCPPLVGGKHQPPSQQKKPAATTTKKGSAITKKPKKEKASRKKKSETTPKNSSTPKVSATKAKTTCTKSKTASIKKNKKNTKKNSNNPQKEPKRQRASSSTGSSSPPQVSPVRSQPPPKIDYTEFRKVMSLRSGRRVDHHLDDDDLNNAAGYESSTSMTDLHLPPLALPAAEMQ